MRSGSLYIHIPYCQAKCPYCDFNSYAAVRWPEEAYVAALCAELRHYAQEAPWASIELRTIFFGGGTPSLFSAASIERILTAVHRLWPQPMIGAEGAACEITVEANPGTVTLEKLTEFRAAGVNRMSFGVQSFAPHHLRTLGRIHGADESVAAVRAARQAGFGNVSIDLIFALPNQTLDEWERDLWQACALRPEHISAYNLTYEEGTAFHVWRAQAKLRQLPEELEAVMFTRTQDILTANGYQQYEISNYARAGRACAHNLNYWHSGPYLGVGAGAHSYSAAAAGVDGACWGRRWGNERSPDAYMRAVAQQGHARSFSEALDARQARGEFVFLGLRCRDGFPAATFRERFGDEFATVFPHVLQLRDDGLLGDVDGRWQLTQRGLLLADSIFTTFV